MIDKFNEIVSGWKNYIFKNKEIENIAKERLKTCLSCDKITLKNKCSVCGCYVPAKVRSLNSKCPNKKWLK